MDLYATACAAGEGWSCERLDFEARYRVVRVLPGIVGFVLVALAIGVQFSRNRREPLSSWVIVTTLGWALGLVAGRILASRLTAGSPLGAELIGAASLSIVLSALQWPVLRRSAVPRASAWIAASALAAIGAAAVCGLIGLNPITHMYSLGLAVGAAQALVLSRRRAQWLVATGFAYAVIVVLALLAGPYLDGYAMVFAGGPVIGVITGLELQRATRAGMPVAFIP